MPKNAKHSLPRPPAFAAPAAPAEKKKWPGWARWLCGYAAVLAGCAGLVYYWRVVFFGARLGVPPAVPLTLSVMAVGTLLYGALFVLCHLKGENVSLKAAMVVFAVGLLFCFATAPLQVPDESKYFLRANSISRGEFGYNYEEDYPDDVDLLIQHFFAPGTLPLNHRVTYAGAQMAPAAFAAYKADAEKGAAPKARAEEPLLFMLLPFLPGGLFMAVARLFGAGALGQLYAARIANLLLYSVICYFAFRFAGRYRGVFFAFALLPVSLFMAASCSYDGLALALCYLAVSVAFADEVDARALLVMGAALMLANYIKPLNFLLAAALLLVPAARWKVKRLKPWMATLAVAAVAVGFWFVMDKIDRQLSYAGGWPRPEDLPRGSGDAPDQVSQLAHMLQNPFRFASVTLLSIYEADGFLFDLGRLGHMDMVIPLAGGLSVLCLCAAAALAVRQKEEPRRWVPWVALGLAAVYAAAVLCGMYVADTDLDSIRITGQQPRYFLPAFLLVFLAFSMLLGRVQRPRLGGEGTAARTEAITLWLCAAVAVFVAILLFQNYFIGQWIQRAEGGWKLVNLLGWEVP